MVTTNKLWSGPGKAVINKVATTEIIWLGNHPPLAHTTTFTGPLNFTLG